MRRYRIIPYKKGSKSARVLSRALGGKRIRLTNSRYRRRLRDIVINWGNSNHPMRGPILNPPALVDLCADKRAFFNHMKDYGCENEIPSFWTNAAEIPDTAFPVVCRTILRGHSGAGVVISRSRDGLVPAPLYVQYVKKQDEFRVHMGRRGEESIILAVHQKRRRHDEPNPNWQIRNHANGFNYARDNVDDVPIVREVAAKVFEASGLDFGAVDVIYNAHHNRDYVLEINTAPGLVGETIDTYRNFFLGAY